MALLRFSSGRMVLSDVLGLLGGLNAPTLPPFYSFLGLTASNSSSSDGGGVEQPFVARLSASSLADGAAFSAAAVWCVSGTNLDGGGGVGAVTGMAASVDGASVTVVGTGDSAGFVVRLSASNGTVTWQVATAAGSGVEAVTLDDDDDVIVVGFTNGTDGASSVLARKLYGSDGDTVWTLSSNSTANGTSTAGAAYGVTADGNDSVVVTGVDDDSAAFVMLLSADSGASSCRYSFVATDGGATSGMAVAADGAGDGSGVTVAGTTNGSLFGTSSGGTDAFSVGFDMSSTDVCEDGSDATLTEEGFISGSTGDTAATTVSVAVAVAGVAVVVAAAAATGSTAAAAAAAGGAGAGGGGGAAAGTTTATTTTGGAITAGSTTQVSPAASLGGALVLQLQFAATLSLVDSENQSTSFSGFADSLGWTNLWVSADNVHRAGGCIAAESSGVGGAVFLGNTVLAVVGLLVIFAVHMLVISGLEAYWLAHDAATFVAEDAERQGLTVAQMQSMRIMARQVSINGVEVVVDGAVADAAADRADGDGSDGCSGVYGGLLADEIAATAARGALHGGIGAGPSDRAGPAAADSEEGPAPAFDGSLHSRSTLGAGAEAVAAALKTPPPQRALYRYESRLDPYDHVLRRSHSIWLYWPHLELLYLLFIFDGALTAQASMFRSQCLILQIIAVVLFVVFPVSILVFVWIVCKRQVRSRDGAVQYVASAPTSEGAFRRLFRGWRGAVTEGSSVLEPFARGHWEPNSAVDNAGRDGDGNGSGSGTVRREADEFRIGFEPLYAEYTTRAVYYVVFRLVKSMALGLVAALVYGALLQTGLMFGIHALDFFVLLFFWPFDNTAIVVVELMLCFVDAASMAVVFFTNLLKGGGKAAAQAWDFVLLLQLVALVLIVVPLYVDTGLSMLHVVRKKFAKAARSDSGGRSASGWSASGGRRTSSGGGRTASAITAEQRAAEKAERDSWAQRRAKHTWTRYWWMMLRVNLAACFNNVRKSMLRRRYRSMATFPKTHPAIPHDGDSDSGRGSARGGGSSGSGGSNQHNRSDHNDRSDRSSSARTTSANGLFNRHTISESEIPMRHPEIGAE
ncbi:unnamed protein product [Phaeothamnion confervicola]